ncbi:hypothetical protein JCM33374_g1433 [Metschnikowia sp. JCM 33374]|nr:hypothetical protein JCM33374_g1433 [Metschnikowia sp. JCM 33374]
MNPPTSTDLQGDQNLSDLQCPKCLPNCGFLAPPDSYKESLRTKAVEKYLQLEHWQNRRIFQFITSQVRRTIGSYGISVSLIYKNTAYVKYETKFEFKELPRVVSIDAHTILSKGGLVILDTTSDWRTSQNPFVTGPPSIRFYAGVNLVTQAGVAIGVFAIFSTLPKSTFSAAKSQELSRVSAYFMDLLDTPLEQIAMWDERALPENPNAGDVELAELSSRLGRATCSGGHMTIFERDGSGSCYSHSHIFKLSHYQEHKQITESFLTEPHKAEIRQSLRRARSLKGACRVITKSIADFHKFDCVVVVEIRFMETHKIPRSNFPEGANKQLSVVPQRVQAKILATSNINAERCKVRILASNVTDHNIANADNRIWSQAFINETGCEVVGSISSADNNAVYNSGVIMPFFVSKQNFIFKNKKSSMEDPVEIYLRSGGYAVGAFNRSINRSAITSSLISQVFDHVKVARSLYLNK